MTVTIVGSTFEQDELLSRREPAKEQTPFEPEEDIEKGDPKFATPPVRRSVRFSADPVSECHEHEHINDFTIKEIENCWYSKKEYKQIRIDYNATVRVMSQSRKWDENEHCGRGLERKTDEGARRREIFKLSSLGAVLREQHRQFLVGLLDEHAIARAYISETHAAKEYAQRKAAIDERAAFVGQSTSVSTDDIAQYFPRKTFQIKNFLVNAGRRRRAVVDDIFALTTSPPLNAPTCRVA